MEDKVVSWQQVTFRKQLHQNRTKPTHPEKSWRKRETVFRLPAEIIPNEWEPNIYVHLLTRKSVSTQIHVEMQSSFQHTGYIELLQLLIHSHAKRLLY